MACSIGKTKSARDFSGSYVRVADIRPKNIGMLLVRYTLCSCDDPMALNVMHKFKGKEKIMHNTFSDPALMTYVVTLPSSSFICEDGEETAIKTSMSMWMYMAANWTRSLMNCTSLPIEHVLVSS